MHMPDSANPFSLGRAARIWAARLLLVVAGVAAWHWTQSLIGQRELPEHGIGDYVLDATSGVHAFLLQNSAWSRGLLMVSSAIIDLLGVFLLASAVFGPTIRPFLGLLMLFALRQVCQALCSLPPPEGMIWSDPGFPSLLVTYGVANDLFFSGHTAIAVFGATELARGGRAWLTGLAVMVAVFQIIVVLLLRAHYTMDVYAGAITALYVSLLAQRWAPNCDRLIAATVGALDRDA
jgi:hypothetical protein